MNGMGVLQIHNAALFVIEWWPWSYILDDNREPKDSTPITTPIASGLISDDGRRSMPLLAHGRTVENDDIFSLWDASTQQWQIYQFRFGLGEESLRKFMIEEAQEYRRWELERKEKDDAPKPGKVHHLKKPGGDKNAK